MYQLDGYCQEKEFIEIGGFDMWAALKASLWYPVATGIREIAEKGNPKNADHTLKNVDSFRKWEDIISQAAKKKLYYPQLNDIVIDSIKSVVSL